MNFIYTKKLKKSTILSILFIGTIVGSSCFISNSFIDEFVFPKWVMFGWCTSLILIMFVFRNFRKDVKLNHYDILFGIIIILISLLLLFKASQFYDIKLVLIFCLFCVICRLCSNICDIQKLTLISFLFSAGISSIFAIRQFLENKDITGCYDNLVGFDITLVFGIMSILYLIKSYKIKRKYQSILFIVMLIFFILIVMTKSRLAILAIIIGYCSLFSNKRLTILISCLSIICIISFIDSKKNESTYGRGFILKTSMTLLDSPSKILMGYGEDGFKSNYMPRQAELLKAETVAVKQRASNIIHPLNEFVLMTIKYGILMPVLSLTLLGLIIFGKSNSSYSKSIALVLLTYSLFSYPLKYPISWISLAVALTISSENKTSTHKTRLILYGTHSIVLFTVGCLLFLMISNSAYLNHNWKIAHTQALLGKKQQSLTNYHKLSQRMNTDEFIFNHASYFHNLGKNTEANSILSNINLVDYETMMLSGKIKESLGLYKDALNDFCLAYDMCPNRFFPLFEIYKIYEKTNNINGQRKYSELIRNKPIKVQSPQIDYIIDYVSRF